MNSQFALHHCCISNKPDVLFIVEPMLEISSLTNSFLRLCGMKFVASNNTGNSAPTLWAGSKVGVDLNVISKSAQQITLEASFD